MLWMSYKGFNRTEAHSFLVAPYCLKVDKQRWYMVGKPDARVQQQDCVSDTAPLNQGATCASALPTTTLTSDSCVGDPNVEYDGPRVYALDRVTELGLTDKKWQFPKGFDANAFFSGHFGVDHQGEPELVRIRVDAMTARYMNTLPLHHSQKEEVKTPEYSEFSFYIALTYDFIQELRKQGSNLQVLAPDHLREKFVQEYQNALDKYRTL